jgi:chromosome partitioning protein
MPLEPLRYSPRQTAEMLGVTAKVLGQTLKKDSYTPNEVWELREKLEKEPPSFGTRKQLFLNFKGGTGKTSLSTSYAWRLAEMGYAVLKKVSISKVIQKSDLPNLDFVPSNLSMSTVDLALMPMSGREFKLKNALKEVEAHYDFIVFDAPPSFGLLNLNALIAADDLIVPVLADFLSFHGLKLLFETVQSLEDDLNHVLDHVFIVVNSFNATFKLAKEALGALQQHYPEFLLSQLVRQCTRFAQASSEGMPIFRFDRDSKGAQDVDALIHEVLKRLKSSKKLSAQPAS